jgi:hypothetical protein
VFYSPERVEGKFCELRLYGFLRSSPYRRHVVDGTPHRGGSSLAWSRVRCSPNT